MSLYKNNLILSGAKYVSENSRDVEINLRNMNEFISQDFNKLGNFKDHWMKDYSDFDILKLDEESRLNFLLIFNALSFSYWGTPKWSFYYKRTKLDGAYGLIAAIGNAVEKGVPILEADFLINLKQNTLKNILKSDVKMPLLKERLFILKEIGKGLKSNYNGSFSYLVREEKDCNRLINLIIKQFPSFNDYAVYNNRRVYFLKRVQLLIWDINRIFNGASYGKFSNLNKLTCFADYKIPFVLRKLGILEYSNKLCRIIDTGITIPKGSKKEIEIRANTIWAVELMKNQLQKKGLNVLTPQIGDYLWILSQNRKPEERYHLTRTTAY